MSAAISSSQPITIKNAEIYACYYQRKDSIFIEKISSTTKSNGAGTKVLRDIVAKSLQECSGKIELDAAWSSHVFWLKMGMIPKEFSISTATVYGSLIETTWKEFPETKKILEQPNGFSLIGQTSLTVLKVLVSLAKNIEFNHVTNEMILSSESDIKTFMEKSWSYTKEVFVHRLLRILKNTPFDQKVPDTTSLSSLDMFLSAEGLNRWKDAIENDKPFVPFRRLEHLQPLMDEKQKQELEEILQKRPNGVL